MIRLDPHHNSADSRINSANETAATDERSCLSRVHKAATSVLAKFSAGLILNIGVSVATLGLKRVQALSVRELAKAALRIMHPSIGFFTIVLTVASVGIAIFKAVNCRGSQDSSTKENLNGNRMDNLGISHIAKLSIANTCGLAYPVILIHELGHAALAGLLYKKANPTITVTPFKGGATSYAISYGLTAAGLFMGKRNANLLIAAGGFLASSFAALALFFASYKLRQEYPRASELLQYQATGQLTAEMTYAASAIFANSFNRAHDYINLSYLGGIHPLVPFACMGAILFTAHSYLRPQEQTNISKPLKLRPL